MDGRSIRCLNCFDFEHGPSGCDALHFFPELHVNFLNAPTRYLRCVCKKYVPVTEATDAIKLLDRLLWRLSHPEQNSNLEPEAESILRRVLKRLRQTEEINDDRD
jgi:hypothetical protein